MLTDSGGIQEETTALGIPCLTLRENTERPVTVELGTNAVVGTDPDRILRAALAALDAPRDVRANPARVPPLWDGRTADRILDALIERTVSHSMTERNPVKEEETAPQPSTPAIPSLVTRRLKSNARCAGDVGARTLALEALRREPRALRAAAASAPRWKDWHEAPARLRPEFARMSAAELLDHFRDRAAPKFLPGCDAAAAGAPARSEPLPRRRRRS